MQMRTGHHFLWLCHSHDRGAVALAAGAVAACGAPIVGWLAERLGFMVRSPSMQRVGELGQH